MVRSVMGESVTQGARTLYIFIRHAECQKNLRHITGGAGAALTRDGTEQAQSFARDIESKLRRWELPITVVSSPSVQAVATAQCIAAQLGLAITVEHGLSQAAMGLVTGLTRAEISDRYPAIDSRLTEWNAGRIEACDLDIPGMEAPAAFWSRCIDSLETLATHGIQIVVTTRSLMVFAANLACGHRPVSGGGYKHKAIGYCDTVAFHYYRGLSEGEPQVTTVADLTTVSMSWEEYD
jgi:broad specificity phosphatase PhoE